MRALIFELEGAVGAGGLDVAGRPVLVRQLQWLRDVGIEDVVIEVAASANADERAELLLSSEPLMAGCTVLPTSRPIGLAALAARTGLTAEEVFLALAANTIVQARFELAGEPTVYVFAPPSFAPHAEPNKLRLCTRRALAGAAPEVPTSGWALRVSDLAAAHALSCAVLAGEAEGLLVHGAEVRPGIWLARGARVAEDATLVPPVLLGAGARVFAQSRLGPNVVVGPGAVIERDVVLSEVSVAADTWVGEGSRVRAAHLDPRGMTSLADGSRTEIDDPLRLTSTRSDSPGPTSRLLALLLLLGLCVPWALAWGLGALLGRRSVVTLRWRGRTLHRGGLGVRGLDLVPPLYDVVRGRRDLIGVAAPGALEREGAAAAPPLRPGAIDISQALAPRASASTLLGMWRWYVRNKNPSLDRELVRARLSRDVDP